MHILIIPSEEYVPEYAPMAGIFQHDQAKILQQKGHQVGALSFTFKYSVKSLVQSLIGKKNKHTKGKGFIKLFFIFLNKLFFPYKSALIVEEIDRIKVVRCDGFWGIKKSNLPLSKYEMWIKYGEFALNYYIQKFGKPDVIHAHNMIYAGLSFIELGRKFNIPVVITEHSTEFALEEQPREVAKKIIVSLKQQGNNIYAVSPKLIALLNLKFFNSQESKIGWLPNVLDTRFEENVEFKLKNNTEKISFFNLANLIPVKGQKELISAFAKAFKQFNNVELVIAGKGILKNELEDLIDKFQLKGKVKLIGLINRDEVVKQMDACDVFVLPSHYETFGVVLIEALSRGVPVLSTYCDGPECIVNDSNGILVQPKDVDELAQAMLKMYHEHNNYNKEQLREDVINQYGKEAFYKRVMEIYNIVIASETQ